MVGRSAATVASSPLLTLFRVYRDTLNPRPQEPVRPSPHLNRVFGPPPLSWGEPSVTARKRNDRPHVQRWSGRRRTQSPQAEEVNPDDPAVIAAIDLVRWELSRALESPHPPDRSPPVSNPSLVPKRRRSNMKITIYCANTAKGSVRAEGLEPYSATWSRDRSRLYQPKRMTTHDQS
jgi:hypothetical protein